MAPHRLPSRLRQHSAAHRQIGEPRGPLVRRLSPGSRSGSSSIKLKLNHIDDRHNEGTRVPRGADGAHRLPQRQCCPPYFVIADPRCLLTCACLAFFARLCIEHL
ncbi:MAG: hypothetical protein ACK55Z_36560, partial [bacterium]